jgi:hypothetical protein
MSRDWDFWAVVVTTPIISALTMWTRLALQGPTLPLIPFR